MSGRLIEAGDREVQFERNVAYVVPFFAVERASNEHMTEKIVPPPKKGATKPRPVRRPQDATPTSDERIHPPRGRQWLLIANYSMFMHEVDS
ncbi:hypothetical protein V7S54_31450 [Ensifer sp. CCNWLY38]